MTGQLHVYDKLRHLRCCTLDSWSLAVLIIHLHHKQTSFSYTKKTQHIRVLGIEGKLYL